MADMSGEGCCNAFTEFKPATIQTKKDISEVDHHEADYSDTEAAEEQAEGQRLQAPNPVL